MRSTPSFSLQSSQPFSNENAAEQELTSGSSFWSAAFVCALAGIFILYSRFFDVVASGFKIPRIVLSLMVLFALMSGRSFIFLRSVVGKLVIALMLWISVTVITSIWKGGSIPEYYQLVQSIVIFAIVASLPITVRNVKRLMNVLALSGLVAALLSIPFGVSPMGRIGLNTGSYYDPNYYAMCLIAIVPFFWAMAAAAESYVVKIFAWAALVPIFVTIARAGSRGAMLGFAVMMLVLLLISPFKTKLLIVTATVGGLVVALAVLPDYLRTRYFTLFEVDSKAAQQVEAPPSADGTTSDLDRLHADSSSAQDRRRLLYTSIALTLEHPLFGVGPGNFPMAVYEEAKSAGFVHNEWLVTHNSYTQISSETGIIGLVIFLAILIASFKSILSVLKRTGENSERPDIAAYAVSKYLFLSMAGLCVSIFFLAVGYELTIYLWAGLAVSLRRTFDAQLALAPQAESELLEPVVPQARPMPVRARTAVAPALPQRATPTVSGRAVRFNRFR